ncbi:hypothetical protein LBMAG57_16760 [Verrucomicrobiota bacterium]|nr:hypothetical protein LBMAG57_16760 [Verrucomicrobiota bacterium]
MRAKTPSIRAVAAAFVLLLTTAASRAVLLDWAALPGGQTWPNSSTSNQFNLDGVAGNDIQITITKSAGITWATEPSNGQRYPQNIADPVIQSGVPGLQMWTSAGMVNSTNNVTVTITFLGTYATGAYVQNLTLFDVDASATFIDRVVISALRGATPVTLTATNNSALGTPANTITGSGTTSVVALGNTAVGNVTNARGDVYVNTGNQLVTSITLVWNNPGPNFGSQAIDLGNITFTPEVGSSSAALALCAGLLVFGRRRQSAARAAA